MFWASVPSMGAGQGGSVDVSTFTQPWPRTHWHTSSKSRCHRSHSSLPKRSSFSHAPPSPRVKRTRSPRPTKWQACGSSSYVQSETSCGLIE